MFDEQIIFVDGCLIGMEIGFEWIHFVKLILVNELHANELLIFVYI
jgi:hypothetical protein